MAHYVYLLASRPGGALYLGSTNDLRRRLEQHRSGAIPGHTQRYGIRTLVWFAAFETYSEALTQERRMKRWRRSWKIDLIAESNPDWQDVSAQIPHA
ncbi:putative endonuclease [Palleronia aestuarii]|uniref:Putative endonuclease n=1 Tax=Palleronia aestuarii TaxID=568105 RepID=A0A2W7NT61_9RHOB|nr:GIY-YIG nuclease family protein [Palleronia aestuarii]PZX16506.1 putative endonuclease [Palleronia aestuarii]